MWTQVTRGWTSEWTQVTRMRSLTGYLMLAMAIMLLVSCNVHVK